MPVVRFCLRIFVFLCCLAYIAFAIFGVLQYVLPVGDQVKWGVFVFLATLMWVVAGSLGDES